MTRDEFQVLPAGRDIKDTLARGVARQGRGIGRCGPEGLQIGGLLEDCDGFSGGKRYGVMGLK